MLPSIMKVAAKHGLELNERSTHSKKDVRFKCPFCQADQRKDDKYYLSLNVGDNVFKCWFCGESGGVLKFIALLEKKSIEEVKQDLFESKSKTPRQLHPAEYLTPLQLKAMGFTCKSWRKMKIVNPERYKSTLNWIWQEWQDYVASLKRQAYMYLLDSLSAEKIKAAVHKYAAEIGVTPEDLLLELTTVKFTGNKKPGWAKSAEVFFALTKKPVSPDAKAKAG